MVIRTALTLIAVMACLDAETLRVMSFNVRYPAKGDGPNLWEVRKDFLIDTVRQSAPDIMGTQELFHEQGQYIFEKLPELAWFGLSRRGNKEDEHMGVFYRKETLELLNSGNFWLSTTPEVPGSMSWNVTLPRMVTWGEFRHRTSNRRFYFYNTHFAHRREDSAARTESAKVLAEWLKKLPAQADVILTGDFNTDASTELYKVLTAILPDALEHAAERKGPT
ncbi:MAG TPA: endonuclease/exonuclease/phosphatase family protein, partial [Bryobacteraceae bacterium]|nr:endonuclease/exonuclease/phosphatase family protein [Bryobacteraceae bacterium]